MDDDISRQRRDLRACAHHGDTDIGGGEGGGVVDPVTDHGNGMSLVLPPPDDAELARRGRLGLVLDAELGRHRAGRTGPVAGDHDQLAYPQIAQSGDDRRRAGPGLGEESEYADDRVLFEDVGDGVSGRLQAGRPVTYRAGYYKIVAAVEEPGTADRDPVPGVAGDDAVPAGQLELIRVNHGQVPLAGRGADRPGQRVAGWPFRDRGDGQNLVLGAADGFDDRQLRGGRGQRAGLVQQHHADPAQRLDAGAALDHDAQAGRDADGGDQRERRRRGERAGGDHQQDGGDPFERPGEEAGDGRAEQNQRQEPAQ